MHEEQVENFKPLQDYEHEKFIARELRCDNYRMSFQTFMRKYILELKNGNKRKNFPEHNTFTIYKLRKLYSYLTSGLTSFIPRADKSASLLSKKPSGRAPFTCLTSELAICDAVIAVCLRSPEGSIVLFGIFLYESVSTDV